MTSDQLLFPDRINEEQALLSASLNYRQALDYTMEEVEKLSGRSDFPVTVESVSHADTGTHFFDTPSGRAEKKTFHLGNSDSPAFNILFITGTHGEESRLWRTGLEAVIQLAKGSPATGALLSRGQVSFDLFSDIIGFDNQSRGFTARDGVQVNAPLITGRGNERNPYGLGDRNSEQGRNSREAVSVLSRSNQAHYSRVCGPLTWIGDHHETNENSQYPSNFFRYGGIMIMAHIYMTPEEQRQLAALRRCLTKTDRIRMALNDIIPFSRPLFREQVLYNNPSLRKIIAIRDRIRELGERTFEDVHEKALFLFPHVERDFSLAESIWVGGEMFSLPGILLGPDIMAPRGITTESFQQDLTVRLRQTLAAMEAELQIAGAER